MRKLIIRILSLVLCFALLFSIASCSHNITIDKQEGSSFWNDVPTSPESDTTTSNTDYWDYTNDPNISISVIGGDVTIDDKENEITQELTQGNIDSIYSLVCSSVSLDLSADGFTCEPAFAQTLDNDNYIALGICYQADDIDFFSDNSIKSVAFVEIVEDSAPLFIPSNEESMIVVSSLTDNDDVTRICTYNTETIDSYHFVYQGKYVVYYQQTPMRVVYSIYDNIKENYDLSLGSLFDYDAGKYIYDETIFGEYQTHSGIELFGEENYKELEAKLREYSAQQLRNGYEVVEYNVVYISPESIQAYLLSEEKDTFFGYAVSDLTEAFGLGTALTYSPENGFNYSAILESNNLEDYNWKSFLLKVGIGSGIIIIGAALSSVTGGASFGCALWTITKITVSASLVSALSKVAIDTTIGLVEGKTIEEALKSASYAGLDTFANTFLITSVVASVGVTTGLIKPNACFVEGTPVAVVNNDGETVFIPIETINVGDEVLSFDEQSNLICKNTVTRVFENKAIELISVSLKDETIVCTSSHPFYSPSRGGWIEAAALCIGDTLLTPDGDEVSVGSINTKRLDNPVSVYNFTVEESHTYFVGKQLILVHNDCQVIDSQTKLRKAAWAEEKEKVASGTSNYNWTSAQIEELKSTGSIKGYEIAHIVDKSRIKGEALEKFKWSTDNTVILRQASRAKGTIGDEVFNQHLWVHNNNWHNPTDTDRIIKLLPWAAEKVENILKLVA